MLLIEGFGFTINSKLTISPAQSSKNGVTATVTIPVTLHELIRDNEGINELSCSSSGKPVIRSEVVASHL